MKLNYLIFFYLILFGACESKDTKNTSNPSIFDWLNSSKEVVSIEIKGDLSHLFVAKQEEDHYHPANIKLENGDSLLQFDIKISRRGVTRKKICDFPPIKLKFPKKTLNSKGFSIFSSYKLVTHCMEGEDNLVLKEYLAYKLYNQLTDKSFRVQLAKIKYIDEDSSIPQEEHYGFLIESNKELASRLEGKLVDPKKYKITQVDKEQYKKMVLFQYMIGNTDWNLTKGHNIKWVQSNSIAVPTPIPYDFDYCGLVNASYALPHPQLPIKNVRERLLQCHDKTKKELIPVCAIFKANKAAFLQLCKEFKIWMLR